MIQHGKTLISEDVLEKEFVCNLIACKGACCIEGEWGAPLEDGEIETIRKELDAIKPFMDEEALKFFYRKGFYETDPDDEAVTTCLPDGACVFAIEENGIHKCAIEKAHLNGKTEFRKPVSCHLYPVRLNKVGDYTGVNYNNWHICSPACKLGAEYQVPVYKFLKESLTRKFGETWYEELEEIAKQYTEMKKIDKKEST